MKTITQITEEKQDKVLQSPMLAQVIMKLKNAFAEEILAYYQYTVLEYFVNTVSMDKKVEKLFKDIIKDCRRNISRASAELVKSESLIRELIKSGKVSEKYLRKILQKERL